MKIIQKCGAYKIKNSREEGTLEVEMLAGEFSATASVPSGKSRGSKEVVAVDVDLAIKNINEIIAPAIIGKEIDIFEMDKLLLELDGTADKSNLGANAILGVSIAILKLSAKIAHQPLWQHIQHTCGGSTSTGVEVEPPQVLLSSVPRLFANVLNGGAHADSCPVKSGPYLTGVDLPFQEYMFVLGDGSSMVEPFNQLQILFKELGEILKEKYGDVRMGDEGGYSPKITRMEEPFEILNNLEALPPNFGGKASKIKIAVDVAANEFYKNDTDEKIDEKKDNYYEILGAKYSSDELLEVYRNLIEKYPIAGLEDPFAESDLSSFAKITKEIGEDVLIVGDDLTATNPKTIATVADEKLANVVIIKPNQIGTVSETLEAVAAAKKAGLKIIVSHRSGETMDSFISDLAVGVGAYGIKAGAPSQPERVVKYERLLEIEQEMS